MDTLFEVAVIDIHPLLEDWNKVKKKVPANMCSVYQCPNKSDADKNH